MRNLRRHADTFAQRGVRVGGLAGRYWIDSCLRFWSKRWGLF